MDHVSTDRLAELYDHFPVYGDRADVAFFVDEAVRSGGPVLELGCGSGRVLIPCARAGVEIVGLDASSAMLDRARTKLEAEPDHVRARAALVPGDMRDFDLDRAFAAITMPFRPFQCLTTADDQLACLDAIGRHLAPGGRLVFDVFNPSLPFLVDEGRLRRAPDGSSFALPGGRTVQRFVRIVSRDLLRQVQHVELSYEITAPGAAVEEVAERFDMRYLFRWELEHLLARAGFEIESLYGDYERTPFGPEANGEIVVVARR